MMSARHEDRVLQEMILKPKTNRTKSIQEADKNKVYHTLGTKNTCYANSASLQRACAQHHPKGRARADLDVDPKLQDGADSRNLRDVLARFAKLSSEHLHQESLHGLARILYIHRYLEF